MKKSEPIADDDDLRPEYDLASLRGGVRGKYLKRYQAGTNLALLAPDRIAPQAAKEGDFHPLLLPNRDKPYRLDDVFEKVICGFCRAELILNFGDCWLCLKADPDFDTITAQFHRKKFSSARRYHSIGSQEPWRQYLNQNIGWTWIGVNQQGYWDSILINFDFRAIVPNILLYVMGSSIAVFSVVPPQLPGQGKIVAAKEGQRRKITG